MRSGTLGDAFCFLFTALIVGASFQRAPYTLADDVIEKFASLDTALMSPVVSREDNRFQHFITDDDDSLEKERNDLVEVGFGPPVERIGPTLLPRADNGRMVILRTFCPFDIDKLEDGFNSWVGFYPCGSLEHGPDPRKRMGVDVLLYFSASWDLWPKARRTVCCLILLPFNYSPDTLFLAFFV